MNRILNIGFTFAGSWIVEGDKIRLELTHYAASKNVLYAFVSDGQVKYIGKTVQQLSKRLQGYQNPGLSQSTNIKNNKNISLALEAGSSVDVFVLPDNGLLHYGGFHVNLAAGLEDALIDELQPEWNGSTFKINESIEQNPEEKIEILIQKKSSVISIE